MTDTLLSSLRTALGDDAVLTADADRAGCETDLLKTWSGWAAPSRRSTASAGPRPMPPGA